MKTNLNGYFLLYNASIFSCQRHIGCLFGVDEGSEAKFRRAAETKREAGFKLRERNDPLIGNLQQFRCIRFFTSRSLFAF